MTPVLVLAESCLDIIGREERMKSNYNSDNVVEGEREREVRGEKESGTRCERRGNVRGFKKKGIESGEE